MDKEASAVKLEIELDVPEDAIDKDTGERLQSALREEAILRLFAERKIPSGHATRLLGLTRLQFMDLIKQRGIPHIVYTFEDWQEDLKDLEEFRRKTESKPER